MSKRTRHAAFAEKPGLLLVGLKNPCSTYENTRHNAGAMLLNSIVGAAGTFSGFETCDGARVAEGSLGGQQILACLPNSFMNLSGRCVQNLARRHNLSVSQIVILHDDLDLAVGRFKIKRGGSSGGHRGVESCAQCLGSADFARVRIGIGRPADKSTVPEFVLEEFRPAEREVLDASFVLWGTQSENLPAALNDAAAMSRLLNTIATPAVCGTPAATAQGSGLGGAGSGASNVRGRSGGGDDGGDGRKSKKAGKAIVADTSAMSSSTPANTPPTAADANPVDASAGADDCIALQDAMAAATETVEQPSPAAREQSYGATTLKAALPDVEVALPDAEVALPDAETDSSTCDAGPGEGAAASDVPRESPQKRES